MKLTKRKTAQRVVSQRITAPITRPHAVSQKRELLLSFVDSRSDPQSVPTNQDLFLYAAGSNEAGSAPDGLDWLKDHRFTIHLDENKHAIGLDIVPSRVYRSGVIPASQQGVETVSVMWELNGAVCRVVKRPAGTKAETLESLIKQLDKMANSNTPLHTNTKVGTLGKVVRIDGDIVEIKLHPGKGKGAPSFELDIEDED